MHLHGAVLLSCKYRWGLPLLLLSRPVHVGPEYQQTNLMIAKLRC